MRGGRVAGTRGGEGLPDSCSAVAYLVLSVGLSIVTGERRNETIGRKRAYGGEWGAEVNRGTRQRDERGRMGANGA